MPARGQALEAFYGGAVWRAHRDAANDTMIDSDNVLLLRSTRPTSGFSLDTAERLPHDTSEAPRGMVVATIYSLNEAVDGDFVDFFESVLQPMLIISGTVILGTFVTENSPNNFPRLPVREGENVFVWFASFPDQAAFDSHLAGVAESSQGEISKELARRLSGPAEVIRLSPTTRSLLRAS